MFAKTLSPTAQAALAILGKSFSTSLMIKKVSWEEVKKFFEKEIKKLAEKYL